MRKTLVRCSVLGVIAVVAAGAAQAHHSYGDFDLCQPVSVRGTVEILQWVNPHVVITVRDQAAVAHHVVWLSLTQTARAGISEGTLHEGDELVVRGFAHRDSTKHAISRVTAVQRPSDGWSWARELPSAASCAPATPPAAAAQN